jgi:putative sigma-54 modulation protein
MLVAVSSRGRIDPQVRSYAEAKLARIERHAVALHEVRLQLEEDAGCSPPCSAEAVAHLQHTRLAARSQATTMREAIDRVVDKLSRQIERRKERVVEHKGHAGAHSTPEEPGPRHAEGGNGARTPARASHSALSRRHLRLRPMPVEEAVAEMETRAEPWFLFLDDEGAVSLLVRRAGELELVVADFR